VYLTKNVCLIFFCAVLQNIAIQQLFNESHRNGYTTLQNFVVLLFYIHQNLNMSTDFRTTLKYQVYENHFCDSLVACREAERHSETSRCRCGTSQCHKKHHNSFSVPHSTIFWFMCF